MSELADFQKSVIMLAHRMLGLEVLIAEAVVNNQNAMEYIKAQRKLYFDLEDLFKLLDDSND